MTGTNTWNSLIFYVQVAITASTPTCFYYKQKHEMRSFIIKLPNYPNAFSILMNALPICSCKFAGKKKWQNANKWSTEKQSKVSALKEICAGHIKWNNNLVSTFHILMVRLSYLAYVTFEKQILFIRIFSGKNKRPRKD